MKHLPAVMLGIVMLGAVTLTADAQVTFALGVRTGLNMGSMSFDPQPYAQNPQVEKGGRTSFMGGVVAELGFARMFAVETGLVFVPKGAKFTLGQASDRVKWSELTFPILFKVKFMQGKIRPYALAGPNLGFVMSAVTVLEEPPNPPQESDLKSGNPNLLKAGSFDFSLDFGGGTEYLITRQMAVFLDLRYSLGLSNLVSLPAQVQQQVEPSWKTRGFQIQVGSFYHL